MYLCYLDESGAPEISANSSHFVLLGMAIPDFRWKEFDRQIVELKSRFGLDRAEIHAAWLLRDYPEQRLIPNFDKLDWQSRNKAVAGIRALNLTRPRSKKNQRELLKNYRQTLWYVHLSQDERRDFIRQAADLVNSWTDSVLFAEAQDKTKTGPKDAFDIAFEQVVTRFNTFLSTRGQSTGLIVQDNNQTVASKLTMNMRRYHRSGTIWSKIDRIIETPLFVDSQLTSMVQVADLCAVAVRRFCEKGERDLFDRIRNRFDISGGVAVGIRHYTGKIPCSCEICRSHGR